MHGSKAIRSAKRNAPASYDRCLDCLRRFEMIKHIAGRDLKEGTRVRTWFMPTGTDVVAIEPYHGPLECLWPEGARIIGFDSRTPSGGTSMTVGNSELLELA